MPALWLADLGPFAVHAVDTDGKPWVTRQEAESWREAYEAHGGTCRVDLFAFARPGPDGGAGPLAVAIDGRTPFALAFPAQDMESGEPLWPLAHELDWTTPEAHEARCGEATHAVPLSDSDLCLAANTLLAVAADPDALALAELAVKWVDDGSMGPALRALACRLGARGNA